MSDEQARERARAALDAQIREYVAVTDDGAFVDSLVLVVHKLSDELDAERKTAVSVAVPDDQSFVLTRGLLDIAITGERNRQ